MERIRILAKLGCVLTLETASLPVVWTALRLTDPERVLESQNHFRRVALRWLLPWVNLASPSGR